MCLNHVIIIIIIITLVDCDHTHWNSLKIISRLISFGAGHFSTAVWAPPIGRHHLGTDRFGAGTSRCWDMSATAVTAPDVSALALYAAVSYASVVVENASFLCLSQYLPYEVPHWLYISKFKRLCVVSRRQHMALVMICM